MTQKEKVFKYLLKKRVSLNLSFIVKGKKPELAERYVDSFIKKTITNFVIHLQEDKIIKSFDDYDMRTMVLAETDDKQKDFTEVVDEINSLIKKQSKKKAG